MRSSRRAFAAARTSSHAPAASTPASRTPSARPMGQSDTSRRPFSAGFSENTAPHRLPLRLPSLAHRTQCPAKSRIPAGGGFFLCFGSSSSLHPLMRLMRSISRRTSCGTSFVHTTPSRGLHTKTPIGGDAWNSSSSVLRKSDARLSSSSFASFAFPANTVPAALFLTRSMTSLRALPSRSLESMCSCRSAIAESSSAGMHARTKYSFRSRVIICLEPHAKTAPSRRGRRL